MHCSAVHYTLLGAPSEACCIQKQLTSMTMLVATSMTDHMCISLADQQFGPQATPLSWDIGGPSLFLTNCGCWLSFKCGGCGQGSLIWYHATDRRDMKQQQSVEGDGGSGTGTSDTHLPLPPPPPKSHSKDKPDNKTREPAGRLSLLLVIVMESKPPCGCSLQPPAAWLVVLVQSRLLLQGPFSGAFQDLLCPSHL